MAKARAQSDIGPSTNGLALPDEATLPYPLRVQAIYVQVSDYVNPDTHPIYTLMDSAGAQHTYSFDLPGQVTRILARPGQIFTKRARMFEFCCDREARAFAAVSPPSTIKPLSAPPIPARPVSARTTPRPQTDQTGHSRRPAREALLLGALATLVVSLVILSQTKLLTTRHENAGSSFAQQPLDLDRASSATFTVSD
jgi:hypothetical protein